MLNFTDAFAEMPLIAIVRGVRPDEVVAVATALYDAGIRVWRCGSILPIRSSASSG